MALTKHTARKRVVAKAKRSSFEFNTMASKKLRTGNEVSGLPPPVSRSGVFSDSPRAQAQVTSSTTLQSISATKTQAISYSSVGHYQATTSSATPPSVSVAHTQVTSSTAHLSISAAKSQATSLAAPLSTSATHHQAISSAAPLSISAAHHQAISSTTPLSTSAAHFQVISSAAPTSISVAKNHAISLAAPPSTLACSSLATSLSILATKSATRPSTSAGHRFVVSPPMHASTPRATAIASSVAPTPAISQKITLRLEKQFNMHYFQTNEAVGEARSLAKKLSDWGWTKLLCPKVHAFPRLVHQWYSSLVPGPVGTHGGYEWFDTTIDGKQYRVTPALIADILQLPKTSRVGLPADYDTNLALSTILATIPGTKKVAKENAIKQNSFPLLLRLFTIFMYFNVFPHGNCHPNGTLSISGEALQLVYRCYQGNVIDISWYIVQLMVTTSISRANLLPYPRLISMILQHVRHPIPPHEATKAEREFYGGPEWLKYLSVVNKVSACSQVSCSAPSSLVPMPASFTPSSLVPSSTTAKPFDATQVRPSNANHVHVDPLVQPDMGQKIDTRTFVFETHSSASGCAMFETSTAPHVETLRPVPIRSPPSPVGRIRDGNHHAIQRCTQLGSTASQSSDQAIIQLLTEIRDGQARGFAALQASLESLLQIMQSAQGLSSGSTAIMPSYFAPRPPPTPGIPTSGGLSQQQISSPRRVGVDNTPAQFVDDIPRHGV